MYWFGVSASTVWSWRKAFGTSRFGTEGSRRLHKVISKIGAVAPKTYSLAERERRRQLAIKSRLVARYFKPGFQGRWWTKKEETLLGKLPDEIVAKSVGRTTNGVRVMRTRLGIAPANYRRRKIS